MKWIDSDECWWCNKGKRTRDHLLKECAEWKKENHELRERVGKASGGRTQEGGRFKDRKWFGYDVSQEGQG